MHQVAGHLGRGVGGGAARKILSTPRVVRGAGIEPRARPPRPARWWPATLVHCPGSPGGSGGESPRGKGQLRRPMSAEVGPVRDRNRRYVKYGDAHLRRKKPGGTGRTLLGLFRRSVATEVLHPGRTADEGLFAFPTPERCSSERRCGAGRTVIEATGQRLTAVGRAQPAARRSRHGVVWPRRTPRGVRYWVRWPRYSAEPIVVGHRRPGTVVVPPPAGLTRAPFRDGAYRATMFIAPKVGLAGHAEVQIPRPLVTPFADDDGDARSKLSSGSHRMVLRRREQRDPP